MNRSPPPVTSSSRPDHNRFSMTLAQRTIRNASPNSTPNTRSEWRLDRKADRIKATHSTSEVALNATVEAVESHHECDSRPDPTASAQAEEMNAATSTAQSAGMRI